jgi:alpha-mannosidase
MPIRCTCFPLIAATVVFCMPSVCRAAAATTAHVEQVVVVFKTHFDIGYTDMAENVVQRYRTSMIDDALAVVDRNRDLPPAQQFVWTLPGWPMHQILDWPEQSPDRKRRIEQALKDGRFVVHALPFSTHTETLEPEEMVRGLVFASRITRQLGLPLPRDAKMTDVACHTWLLPTLLKHAGVDFFHLGSGAYCVTPEVPPLFWWEGPDGSRLLTMYTPSYGTGLAPPPDWPYRTWLALIHTTDNHGPPQPEEIRKLLDEAGRKLPGVKVRIGRLSDFAAAILAENPKLPVVHGDMTDTWIHGPMSDPAGAILARNTRPAIAASELLNTQLRAWGVAALPSAATIAAAYEQSLLYGEHTWGGSLTWLRTPNPDKAREYPHGELNFPYGKAWHIDRAEGRFASLEASWKEHTRYIETARDLIRPLLHSQLEQLAGAVSVPGQKIVVFNPLPRKRDGLVSLPVGFRDIPALESVNDHEQVPVNASGGQLSFVARDVPPIGYRTYVAVKRAALKPADAAAALSADDKTASLESPAFKAVIDPQRGTVRSLVAKRSGRELLDSGSAYGFGQYLYERFDADQVSAWAKAYVTQYNEHFCSELGKPPMPPASEAPYQALSPSHWSVRWEQTPISVAAVMHAPAGADLKHAVTTRLVLYRDLPYADLELTVHDKPADSWPEAGWICLPVRAKTPQFRLGRPGSIIDPATDILPGANRHMLAVNTGLTVTDGSGPGMGLCPLDDFVVSLGMPGCMKFSRDYVPRKPVVFVNLFNNHWTTNFRMWNEGTWTSRVRLWAIDHYDPQLALIQPSLEARHPLVSLHVGYRPGQAAPKAGALPPAQSGLETSRPGVLVTAFGDNPDGRGTLLRLWELAGTTGPCRVTLPSGISTGSVRPVNLRGESTGKPIAVEDGSFTVMLNAFAPASFVIGDGI